MYQHHHLVRLLEMSTIHHLSAINFQSNVILAGLGLAAAGFAGRYVLRRIPNISERVAQAMKSLPTSESFATNKYYKGGFEAKMSKREASLILGVSPSAAKGKVGATK